MGLSERCRDAGDCGKDVKMQEIVGMVCRCTGLWEWCADAGDCGRDVETQGTVGRYVEMQGLWEEHVESELDVVRVWSFNIPPAVKHLGDFRNNHNDSIILCNSVRPISIWTVTQFLHLAFVHHNNGFEMKQLRNDWSVHCQL